MTDHDRAPDLRSRLAALAGVDAATESANRVRDTLSRARWALAHNDGHPNGAWSTGEQLAVALVLDDVEHLAAMDYTAEQAMQRVADGMHFPPTDVGAWLEDMRAHLAHGREGDDRG